MVIIEYFIRSNADKWAITPDEWRLIPFTFQSQILFNRTNTAFSSVFPGLNKEANFPKDEAKEWA